MVILVISVCVFIEVILETKLIWINFRHFIQYDSGTNHSEFFYVVQYTMTCNFNT